MYQKGCIKSYPSLCVLWIYLWFSTVLFFCNLMLLTWFLLMLNKILSDSESESELKLQWQGGGSCTHWNVGDVQDKKNNWFVTNKTYCHWIMFSLYKVTHQPIVRPWQHLNDLNQNDYTWGKSNSQIYWAINTLFWINIANIVYPFGSETANTARNNLTLGFVLVDKSNVCSIIGLAKDLFHGYFCPNNCRR